MPKTIIKQPFQYVALLNEGKTSIIEVLKVGKIRDRDLNITEDMLEDFVKNFKENVYGSEIQINLGHNRGGEAAGWVKKLIKEGGTLFAQVEWTPLGIEKIKSKQFKFTSSELSLSHPHHETGKKVKNVFIGVALTNIPAVKGMKEVTLSEKAEKYIHNQNNMDKLKEMFVSLMAKESLSKDEIKKFEEEAAEVKGEENKEEVEKMEKEVAEKGEGEGDDEKKKEEEEAAKKAEEEAAAAKDEEEKKELAEKAKGKVSLTEFAALQEKTARLEEEIDLKNLTEEVVSDLKLSEENMIGFVDKEDLDEVVDFMKGLSQEQREQFKGIVYKVQTVDLSVHGSVRASKAKTLSEDTVVERADELLAEAKKAGIELDITDAQKQARKELMK